MAEGVGGFTLEGYSGFERIGRGGFSVVYRARHDRLGRDVAVKVLSADLSDPADLRRFETECLVMGRLGRHRHVVDVHDAGVSPTGHPYIVMKLYPGGTLADQLRDNGAMPVADVVDVGTKLASALAAAHAEGVVHRDIKPENVLIDEDGEPVVTDFGVAAVADPDGRLTSSIAFSRAYVAPEVLDRNEYGTASDIYSLGATLYTMLSGRPVFQATTEARTVIAVLQEAPAPIGRTDVPAQVEAIVMRCLDKKPADRYDSAEAAGAALALTSLAPSTTVDHTRGAVAAPSTSPTAVVDPAPVDQGLAISTNRAGMAADATVRRHNLSEAEAARTNVKEPQAADEAVPDIGGRSRANARSDGSRRSLVAGVSLVAILLVAAAVWGLLRVGGSTEPPVAARVGPTVISQARLADAAAEVRATLGTKMPEGVAAQSDLDRDLLTALIGFAIFDEAANRQGITVTPEEVAEVRNAQVKAIGSGGQLIEAAAREGIPESYVDSWLRAGLQANKLRANWGASSDTAYAKFMSSVSNDLGVDVDPRYGSWSTSDFTIIPPQASPTPPTQAG